MGRGYPVWTRSPGATTRIRPTDLPPRPPSEQSLENEHNCRRSALLTEYANEQNAHFHGAQNVRDHGEQRTESRRSVFSPSGQ